MLVKVVHYMIMTFELDIFSDFAAPWIAMESGAIPEEIKGVSYTGFWQPFRAFMCEPACYFLCFGVLFQ